MREPTSLVKSFDSSDSELIETTGQSAEEVFLLPDRNWNGLIDGYNASNKKKFPLTALQCRTIVEYAKKSIPPIHIFEAIGVSKAKYNFLCTEAQEYDDKLQEMAAKEIVDEEEFEFFHKLLRHPLRVLMADIARAEGISKIMDWEKFNKNVDGYPDAQFAKMKARFKDYFSDKDTPAQGFNVSIILAGDYIKDI